MSKRSLTRVTAGKALFIEKLDGRCVLARRFREVYQRILGEGQDDDPPTETRNQLARRAAMLSIQAELMEAAFARGEEVDMGLYTRISNSLSRLLTKLEAEVPGPQREARNPVREYSEAKRRQKSAA